MKEVHFIERVDILDILMNSEENGPFSKRSITADQKRIPYNNVEGKLF